MPVEDATPVSYPKLSGDEVCRRPENLVHYDMAVEGGVQAEEHIVIAKRLCLGCPVRADCSEWAIATGQHGVWGGTDEEERRRIRRSRRVRPVKIVGVDARSLGEMRKRESRKSAQYARRLGEPRKEAV